MADYDSSDYDVDGGAESPNEAERDEMDRNDAMAQQRFCEMWFKRVDKAKELRKNFNTSANNACKRYNIIRNEASEEGAPDVWYPLLWSNVQVIKGAMYTATPNPDVRQRNGQNQPDQKIVAMMLERGLTFAVDQHDFNGNIERALTDNLVAGLGQIRVSFDADVNYEPIINPETGQPGIDEQTGEPLKKPVIKNDQVFTEFVPWDRFYNDPCMDWKECQWVDFIHFLERKDIEEQFGIDPKNEKIQVGETSKKEGKSKYEVHEIWDKRKRRIVFLLRGMTKPLAVKPDLLHLKDFFPCPKPMLSNCQTNKFEGVPDYSFYKVQDIQINRLTQRIINLTSAGTVARGLYDASIQEEMEQLSASDDLEYVPVPNLWGKLTDSEASGSNLWDKVVADFPIRNCTEVISILQAEMQTELQAVYSITGISDIMRGQSKASETAGAQQIKAQAASNRMSIRKQSFHQFIRSIMRIMAEMSAEHLQPSTWQMMTGMPMNPQIDEIMHNDLLRNFSVDIETDSTIAMDDKMNKEMTMEAVNVTTQMLGTLLPMMNQGLPGDVVKQITMVAMRPFKQSRAFEDAVETIPSTMQQTQQMQQQMQQMGQQMEQMGGEMEQMGKELEALEAENLRLEQIKVVAEAQRDGAQSARLGAQRVDDMASAELSLAKAEQIRRTPISAGNSSGGR